MSRKKSAPSQEVIVLPLPENLWDVEGVQQFLGVSRPRVFQLIKHKGLPCLKWDRTLRFHPVAIARWLAEQQQRGA